MGHLSLERFLSGALASFVPRPVMLGTSSLYSTTVNSSINLHTPYHCWNSGREGGVRGLRGEVSSHQPSDGQAHSRPGIQDPFSRMIGTIFSRSTKFALPFP